MKFFELAPLVVFFILYKIFGIMAATIGIVFSTVVSVIVSIYVFKQKINRFNIFSIVLMILMSALTIFTNNTQFIKIKPTIFYILCACILAVGMFLKKNFVQHLFGKILHLSMKQWNIISLQWIVFLLILALCNEIIWRSYEEAIWVNYKVFCTPVLLMVFMLFQVFIFRKHIVIEQLKEQPHIKH